MTAWPVVVLHTCLVDDAHAAPAEFGFYLVSSLQSRSDHQNSNFLIGVYILVESAT